jgi:hypothetical protein
VHWSPTLFKFSSQLKHGILLCLMGKHNTSESSFMNAQGWQGTGNPNVTEYEWTIKQSLSLYSLLCKLQWCSELIAHSTGCIRVYIWNSTPLASSLLQSASFLIFCTYFLRTSACTQQQQFAILKKRRSLNPKP